MKYLGIVLFVVVIVLIMVFLLDFTNIETPQKSYPLKAFFKNAGGIKAGAPIMMAGLEVGQVESVELNPDKRGVDMNLAIFEGIQIPKDSELKVSEKGMLGEMYLSFSFGKSTKFFAPSEDIEGKPPVSLTDFMGDAGGAVENVGREVSSLAKSMNEVIGDQEFQKNIKDTMDDLKTTIDKNKESIRLLLETFNLLGKNSNELILDVKEEVNKLEEGKVMKNIALVTENLVKVSQELSAVTNKIDPLVDTVHKTVKGFNGIGSDVKVAVQQVNKTLEGMEGIGGEMKQLVTEVHTLAKKLNLNKGTSGKLINDGDLYDNLNELMIKTSSLVAILEDNPSSLIWGKRKKSRGTDNLERRYNRLRDDEVTQNPQPVLPEQFKINDP